MPSYLFLSERDGDNTRHDLHAPGPYPEDSSGGEGPGAQEEEVAFGGDAWIHGDWGGRRQSNVCNKRRFPGSGSPQRHRWPSGVKPTARLSIIDKFLAKLGGKESANSGVSHTKCWALGARTRRGIVPWELFKAIIAALSKQEKLRQAIVVG